MRNIEYRSIWEERKAEEERKRDVAIEKAKSIAKILRRKYHAKEVFLFGSLIWRPDFLWAGTDIDLMAKGLKGDRYFEILADVSTTAHPFHIDLIPFEKAEASIKERVLREGIKLE
jgi:predicted nucleotidyltransferase